jgi:Ca2+-binding EF-hand superfamily protein
MKVSELINLLETEYETDDEIAVRLLSTKDVHDCAAGLGAEMSEETAETIIQEIDADSNDDVSAGFDEIRHKIQSAGERHNGE